MVKATEFMTITLVVSWLIFGLYLGGAIICVLNIRLSPYFGVLSLGLGGQVVSGLINRLVLPIANATSTSTEAVQFMYFGASLIHLLGAILFLAGLLLLVIDLRRKLIAVGKLPPYPELN